MNYNDILELPPDELFKHTYETYIHAIPCSIDSSDDLKNAGQRMCELTNSYSYLMSMCTLANIRLRDAKSRKSDKQYISDMTSRRDTLQNTAEIVKSQYAAISRLITVKKQVDEEMRMI